MNSSIAYSLSLTLKVESTSTFQDILPITEGVSTSTKGPQAAAVESSTTMSSISSQVTVPASFAEPGQPAAAASTSVTPAPNGGDSVAASQPVSPAQTSVAPGVSESPATSAAPNPTVTLVNGTPVVPAAGSSETLQAPNALVTSQSILNSIGLSTASQDTTVVSSSPTSSLATASSSGFRTLTVVASANASATVRVLPNEAIRGDSNGLSNGVKVFLVSLSVFAVLAAAAGVAFFLWRKKRAQDTPEDPIDPPMEQTTQNGLYAARYRTTADFTGGPPNLGLERVNAAAMFDPAPQDLRPTNSAQSFTSAYSSNEESESEESWSSVIENADAEYDRRNSAEPTHDPFEAQFGPPRLSPW